MYPRLSALTAKRVIKILKKHGFTLDHTSGSHYIFYNAFTKARVTVPFHRNDLPRGTLVSIIKQSGLDTHLFFK